MIHVCLGWCVMAKFHRIQQVGNLLKTCFETNLKVVVVSKLHCFYPAQNLLFNAKKLETCRKPARSIWTCWDRSNLSKTGFWLLLVCDLSAAGFQQVGNLVENQVLSRFPTCFIRWNLAITEHVNMCNRTWCVTELCACSCLCHFCFVLYAEDWVIWEYFLWLAVQCRLLYCVCYLITVYRW